MQHIDINALSLANNLSPLEGFAPTRFCYEAAEERADAFVLALAAVFNDLKNVIAISELATEIQGGSAEVCPKNGELAGIRIHMHRLAISIIWELFELIKLNRPCLEDPAFLRAVRKLAPLTLEAWNEVVSLSVSDYSRLPARKRRLRSLFPRVRANGTFHYSQIESILKGYRRSFENLNLHGRNKAYMSLGDCMENTRFYFADAALEGVVRESFGDCQISNDEINKWIKRIGRSLRYLVSTYISEKCKNCESKALENHPCPA